MQISTFHIDSGKNAGNYNSSFPHLDLVDYQISENRLDNVVAAITWLERNGEDAGLIVHSDFEPDCHDFDSIFQSVIEMAEEGIFIFALGASGPASAVAVSNSLGVVESWEGVSGWIILMPMFDYLKKIVAGSSPDNKNITLESLFNPLSPTKLIFSPGLKKPSVEHRIHAIVPFRNVTDYIEECLSSIAKQKYENYSVILIDDCSDDDSLSKVPSGTKIKVIVNKERKFALKNIVECLVSEEFEANDIICLVDGDDRLSHPYVFNILNEVYSNSDALLSYGSFRHFKSLGVIGAEYSEEEFADIRRSIWKATHLKTFKYNLFGQYLLLDPDLEHLKNGENEVLTMPYDMALMFPLLEISGKDRSKFIGTPLYMYRLHGGNDHHANRQKQAEGESIVRSKTNITRKPSPNVPWNIPSGFLW